mmetsp:Transcript_1416/g.3578  ORF Transcript_1416/g.3578 Transcript_1416/m.3578 type:complete len:465 (-) Transcript_1416:31-1425(-)
MYVASCNVMYTTVPPPLAFRFIWGGVNSPPREPTSAIGLPCPLLLLRDLPIHAMGHIALLHPVRLAHIPPIPHVQTDNRLSRRGHHIPLPHRPQCRARSAFQSELLRSINTPGTYPRPPLLDQKAKVEYVLDRLREALGIEEAVHCVDLRALPHELFFLPEEDGGIVLPTFFFVVGHARHRRFPLILRAFLQRVSDDANVPLDRAQLVAVALLLTGLIDVLRLLLLSHFLLHLRALATLRRLLAFLGHVLGVEGTVEEVRVGGGGVEAYAHLEAEAVPVELGCRMGAVSGADGALFDEGLGEADGIVAGDLHELLRLPRRLPRDQIHILRIQHRLPRVMNLPPERVVLIPQSGESIDSASGVFVFFPFGVVIVGAVPPHGDIVVKIPLTTAQHASIRLGLAARAHDLGRASPFLFFPAIVVVLAIVLRIFVVAMALVGAVLAVFGVDVVVVLGGVPSLLVPGHG